MEEEKKLILDVEENPKKVSEWILFAIQHILAMFVACVTVPALTGLPIAPTICAAGVGTLIYIFATKKKSPVFLSSSFAYLSPMYAALTLGTIYAASDVGSRDAVANSVANYPALMIGMLIVGIIYIIIAVVIHFVGTNWLNKLLPPLVIGPVIMVIGISLAGSAVSNIVGTYSSFNGGAYNWASLATGLVALLATCLSAHYGKKLMKLIPFVIGVGAGYVFGSILTIIGFAANVEYLKVIDFSPIVNNFTNISFKSFFSLPNFIFLSENFAVSFKADQFLQILVLFAPVALVTICEHIGDHKNLSGIIGRDLLGDEPGLTRTLIGDGLATAVSGGLCGAANTTYGENVAVVGVSGIASVGVIILAAIITIAMAFFTPLMVFVETLPNCITGGVSLVLYGFIASSGVKMLIKEKIDFGVSKNIFVAAVILIAGIGGLTFKFGPVTITSIAVAMILGIVLNLILVDPKKETVEKEEIKEDNDSVKE